MINKGLQLMLDFLLKSGSHHNKKYLVWVYSLKFYGYLQKNTLIFSPK